MMDEKITINWKAVATANQQIVTEQFDQLDEKNKRIKKLEDDNKYLANIVTSQEEGLAKREAQLAAVRDENRGLVTSLESSRTAHKIARRFRYEAEAQLDAVRKIVNNADAFEFVSANAIWKALNGEDDG